MLPRARTFVCDGVRWLAWPSVAPPAGSRRGCEEPLVALGPPRIFFRSECGDFYSWCYEAASWGTVAQLSEDELCAELRLATATS